MLLIWRAKAGWCVGGAGVWATQGGDSGVRVVFSIYYENGIN